MPSATNAGVETSGAEIGAFDSWGVGRRSIVVSLPRSLATRGRLKRPKADLREAGEGGRISEADIVGLGSRVPDLERFELGIRR